LELNPQLKEPAVTYEEVPYVSLPFRLTHPHILAVAAALAGLKPAPVHQCRVLEIGCASGGNLLPMAATLPRSQFVGVDLGAKHIAAARDLAARAEIRNVELHCQDICQFIPEGEFDYIIAHGIYSWVPEKVRERLVEICGRHLAPNGVAFISYMVYPGAYVYEAFRHAIRMLNRHGPPPPQLAAAARRVVEIMGELGPKMAPRWGPLVHKWSKDMSGQADYAILHDQLEAIYHPVYFTTFLEHAARHGLRHLSDSTREQWQQLPVIRDEVQKLTNDPMERNQLVDIAGFRMFRQSIMGRADAAAAPADPLDVVERAHLASDRLLPNPQKPGEAPEPLPPGNPQDEPVLNRLAKRYPRTMSFAELAMQINPLPAAAQNRALAATIFRLYESRQLELWMDEPRYIAGADDPSPVCINKLARVQSAGGEPVTNLRHLSFNGHSAKARRLVASLDGSPLSDEAREFLPALARTSLLYRENYEL
jgi:SAM-dependent methyltransferase